MTGKQQRIWDAERVRRRLTRGHERFAATGLMTELDEPRLLVTVIPSDPLAPLIDFDDNVFQVVPQSFTGRTANGVAFLGASAVTDDALVRVATGGNGGWRAYAAIRRVGAVEVGMGSTTRYEFENGGEARFAFRLYYIIHAIRVVVESQARLFSNQTLSEHSRGPFELIVALPKTAGAVLGGLAEGWEEPGQMGWDIPESVTEDVLIRTQFDTWPASQEEQEAAIVRVGDRVCNAFGSLQRLFAPPNGRPRAGILSPDYA